MVEPQGNRKCAPLGGVRGGRTVSSHRHISIIELEIATEIEKKKIELNSATKESQGRTMKADI